MSSLPPITALDWSTVRALAPEVATLATSLSQAIEQNDPVRAGGLVLAARLEGAAVISGEQLLWLLRRFEDPMLLPCLVGACAEPIPVLVQILDEWPGWDTLEAAFLTLALVLDGQPLPASLMPTVRRLVSEAERNLRAPLAVTLELLQDESLQAPRVRPYARLIAPRYIEAYGKLLRGDFREALRERGEGLPQRRATPKVGRNDPCPCGSGAKFKKCCQDKPETLAYQRWQQPAAFRPMDLPLHHLVQVRTPILPSNLLELVLEDLAHRGPLDLAEVTLEELLDRPDCVSEADSIRMTFLIIVCRRDGGRLQDKQIERLEGNLGKALRQLFSVQLDALVPLLDNSQELQDLAYLTRLRNPVCSVLLARAAMFPGDKDGLDRWSLCNTLSDARAELGLGPDDPLHDFEEDEEDEEHQALQTELSEARQRLAQLEAEAKALARQKPTQPEVKTVPATPAPLTPPPDPEAQKLRARLTELKDLLRERNQERAELRQKLKAQSKAETRMAQSAQPQAPEELEFEDELRLPPLIPLFSKNATRQLPELPAPVARQALTLAGELAAGLPAAWQKCKRLQQPRDLHSIRLGLYHRMLFRREETHLQIEELIARESLEQVLRNWNRS